MAKAMLIMDMPQTCYECPFLDEADNCLAMDVYYTDVEVVIEKPTWCPLRECPSKQVLESTDSMGERTRKIGYNACIDEILGGVE